MRPLQSKPMPFVGAIGSRVSLLIFLTVILSIFRSSEADGQWFLFGRAQRQYERCVELYTAKQFDEARQCMLDFFSTYPNSRWIEHLQFLEAKMETNVTVAESKLRRFVLEYPNGAYSAEANVNLGELYELKGDHANAQKCYSRVYLYFPASEVRDEAGLRMGKCMLLRGDTDAAREHLEKYLATHQAQPWHSLAKELYADALYQAGEHLRAQDQYKQVISEASSPGDASPRCYLKIAEIYEGNGNYEAALQTYRQFLNIFPHAIQKPEAEKKLAQLASMLKVDLSISARAYIIEAGKYESEHEAMGLVARLKKLGYQAYLVTRRANRSELFSVRLGPYGSRDSARAVADRLNKEAGLEVALLPQGGLF